MSQLNLTDRIRPGWAPNQLRPGERCRLVLHPTQHISVLGLLDDVLSWRAPTNGGPWTAPDAVGRVRSSKIIPLCQRITCPIRFISENSELRTIIRGPISTDSPPHRSLPFTGSPTDLRTA
jgi:hypothetical protein